MKVVLQGKGAYTLLLDDEEMVFIAREALENELTIQRLLEMVLAMLFVGGYSALTGKD